MRLASAILAAAVSALLVSCNQSVSNDPSGASASASATSVEASGSAAPAAPAAASGSASAAAFTAGSMPIHPVQVNATLTSLTGVDTAQAVMSGRVTEADAREFCERNPNMRPAVITVPECVSETLAEEAQMNAGPTHTARADCVAGTLSSSDWSDFRLTGTEPVEGSASVAPIFVNSEGTRVTGNADGGASAAALFEVLCPTRARAWTANR